MKDQHAYLMHIRDAIRRIQKYTATAKTPSSPMK